MRIVCRAYDLDAADGCGAELRAIADHLRVAGDDVWAASDIQDVSAIAAWRPELIVAHQWATGEASGWAATLRVPFVMLVHGPGQYEHFMPPCDLVVFATRELYDLARPALGRTPAAVWRPAPRSSGLVEDHLRPDDARVDDITGLGALRERLITLAAVGRRRPTLTLCMTVANEGATLEQAIASVSAIADEIVIGVDSRSDDDTAAIAGRLATRTFTFTETSPPDFPRMRNRAMSLVETDWAIVLDGHEWIEHAHLIPSALETAAWSIEIETLFEPDEQRIPGLAFPFPRIHRRHVRFAGAAAHEEVTTPWARRESRLEIKVWHERKPGRASATRSAEKAGAELTCLRRAWTDRGDRRALFYLANGLREAGRHPDAIEAYDEYLRAPGFADEAWQARLYRARCLAAAADWPAARSGFEEAVLTGPERAEAAVGLGHVLLAAGEPRQAAAWFRMATGLPRPASRMFVEVPVYCWGAWHGLALALHGLGDYGGAADAEARAAEGGAGSWASDNVASWRARAEGRS